MEDSGDYSPTKVTLSALGSNYGYVVGSNVVTKALEVIGDEVDTPESRLAEVGTIEKLR